MGAGKHRPEDPTATPEGSAPGSPHGPQGCPSRELPAPSNVGHPHAQRCCSSPLATFAFLSEVSYPRTPLSSHDWYEPLPPRASGLTPWLDPSPSNSLKPPVTGLRSQLLRLRKFQPGDSSAQPRCEPHHSCPFLSSSLQGQGKSRPARCPCCLCL